MARQVMVRYKVAPELAAFQRFLDGIAERCTEQPVTSEFVQIGAFRIFGA